jgi:CRP/FNR family transcriptional regulator
MNNLELLQNTVLFKSCGRDEVSALMALFQERQMKPHTAIFSENMPAEAFYLVKSGTIKITMMAGEGVERELLLLGSGDFFGELSLIQESNRLVSARAVTDVEILLLTRKDFLTLIELEPRAAAKILVMMARLLALRIKAQSDKLKKLLMS